MDSCTLATTISAAVFTTAFVGIGWACRRARYKPNRAVQPSEGAQRGAFFNSKEKTMPSYACDWRALADSYFDDDDNYIGPAQSNPQPAQPQPTTQPALPAMLTPGPKWNDWVGGPCPVSPWSIVEVIRRSGTVEVLSANVDLYQWQRTQDPERRKFDILAYRVWADRRPWGTNAHV